MTGSTGVPALSERLHLGGIRLGRGLRLRDGLLAAVADLTAVPIEFGNGPVDRLQLPRRGVDLDEHDRHLAVDRAHYGLQVNRLLGFGCGALARRGHQVGAEERRLGIDASKQEIFVGLDAKSTGSPEAGTRHTYTRQPLTIGTL